MPEPGVRVTLADPCRVRFNRLWSSSFRPLNCSSQKLLVSFLIYNFVSIARQETEIYTSSTKAAGRSTEPSSNMKGYRYCAVVACEIASESAFRLAGTYAHDGGNRSRARRVFSA